MFLTIIKYYLFFIFTSFFGWLTEVIYTFFKKRKFVNRGYLIEPICPIYGNSCLILVLLLHNIDNIILLGILSLLIIGILEYLTSYLLDKIFHVKLWDYSKYKGNIDGRVAPFTLIPFAFFGVIVVKYLYPFIFSFLDKFSNNALIIMFSISFIILIIDNIISTKIIKKIGKKHKKKDITELKNEELKK